MSTDIVRLDLGMVGATDVDPRVSLAPQLIQNFTHSRKAGVQAKRFGVKYYVASSESANNYDKTVTSEGGFSFYKANGDKYIFVVKGQKLCVEKGGTWVVDIDAFFKTAATRVRGVEFNDRFWFVDANNVLRWYSSYDDDIANTHVWAIANLDRPLNKIADLSSGTNYDEDWGYGISFERHVDHNNGIDGC